MKRVARRSSAAPTSTPSMRQAGKERASYRGTDVPEDVEGDDNEPAYALDDDDLTSEMPGSDEEDEEDEDEDEEEVNTMNATPSTSDEDDEDEGPGYAQYIDPDEDSEAASEDDADEENMDEEDALRQRTSLKLTQKSHRFPSPS